MAKIPIFWRNGRAYYRKRIPQDLVATIGKKEIQRSLGTTDKTEAKKQWAIENAKAESWFAELRERASLANDNPDQLSGYGNDQLAGLALRWLDYKQRDNFQRRIKDKSALTEEAWREVLTDMREEFSAIENAIKLDDRGRGLAAAERWLEEQGITYDSESEAFQTLGQYMNQAIFDLTKSSLQRLKGVQVFECYSKILLMERTALQ